MIRIFCSTRIKLKITICLVFCSLFQSGILFSQGRWEKKSTITSKNLKSIFFIDSLKGWVAGDSGIILYTTDAGNNWSIQQSNITTAIHDLFFLDSLNGWGLTWHYNIYGPAGTTILKTTNGGQTWNAQPYPRDLTFFYSIFFNDLNNGWICGEPGAILRTRNGGETWDEVKFLNTQYSEFPIFKIKFFDNNFAIGCGGVIDIFGVIWRTTDGGEFWDAFPIGPEPINDFQIISQDFVFAVGGDYEYGTAVSHSTDKGLTWNYRTLDIFGIANSVAFRNSHEGWINLKGERKFLVTTDSGRTWTEYITPDSVQPNKIVFVDSLHGYAVCDSGYFLIYKPPTSTYVNQIAVNAKEENLLSEIIVYPNPFNSTTEIIFKTFTPQKVKLELYSLVGELIGILFNDWSLPGEQRIRLQSQNLTSGVYFLVLRSDKAYKYTKLILIK